MYDPVLVKPMREDLTNIGVKELLTAGEVDAELNHMQGTALVVVNSVCGCAAANARPAVKIAMNNSKLPDKMLTVFAGQYPEATQQARSYIKGFPPSSPSMALFKNGEVVYMLERYQIEGRYAEDIAQDIVTAFNEFC
ncbi:MAG: BrxA/BrxB family bacilliredoxin [Calditrichaeota bacterium]|nr:BrxA/BrxB family bacilliredoxin [Calditrichota bacterium]